MNLQQFMRAAVCAALAAVCVVGAGWFSTQPVAGQETNQSTLQGLHGAAALDRLKQDGQYESLQAAMNQARFSVSRMEATPLGRWAWHAPNAAAGYDAYVTEAGVSLVLNGALNDQSYVSLHLRSLGYGAALHGVTTGEVSGDKQSISITRGGGLREWFVNGADGLEHGFTLNEPPSGARQQGLPLRLALQVGEGWRAIASEDGQRVTLRNGNEQAVEYGKLVVRDTRGLNIPARLTVADEQVVIEVEDHNAQYPLTIDPLFTLQQRLLAADGTAFDYLGHAVALDGNTALIGAPADDTPNSDQGAAYVFVRNGATQPVWTFQKKLTANDGHAGAQFGTAVALNGATALVGAPEQRVGTKPGQGAAYVFVRDDTAPNTVWTLQKQLTANDGEELDRFGAAVALDGDTALIGAPNDNVMGGPDLGSAYVFTRGGAAQPVWTQQKKLTDTINADDNDQFGSAVAISGDKILIGIPLWGGDDHGVVAAFKRGATGWEQVNGINEPNPAANAHFGASVALSGDWVAVGSPSSDIGGTESQGSVTLLKRTGTNWSNEKSLTANDGAAFDYFGRSVALSGDKALVGAPGPSDGERSKGAAYVFERSATQSQSWGQRAKLLANDGQEPWSQQARLILGEGYPYGSLSVALSGNTAIVGTSTEYVEGRPNQGMARVFTRSGTGWTPQQHIVASDGRAHDSFGHSVAISGDTILAGAIYGGSSKQGVAYVLKKNCGTTMARLTSVSAASFAVADGLAPESISAGFGTNLATETQAASSLPLPTTLAGVSLKVTDGLGTERLAPLFFVSPGQINYLIPAGTANGPATLTVLNAGDPVASGETRIASAAPGLFSADSSGEGVAAALALRIKADGSQSYEPVAQFDSTQNRFVPAPIDLGPGADQVFLVFYGTGLRYRSSLSAVSCLIGGVVSESLFAGAVPGFAGLDQVNVRLPRSLASRGEVGVALFVDGEAANRVRVSIR